MAEAIYIAGPTASGKSSIALLLARKLNGEIISVDSMQVYRGLDIGTAKPSLDERQLARHHLIDVAEPDQSFDAARFVRMAGEAEKEIRARGCIPIFCGGTGLYFNALLGGLGGSPPADPELRASLAADPLERLLEELREKDPDCYATIDRMNRRRVVRAVEVIRLTGKPFSQTQPDWSQSSQQGHWFGLERERGDLVQRIGERVDAMFAAGLVEETRALLERGLEENPTAMQAIGYRQVVEHLRGARDLGATIELIKQRTRQFAKRQMTWFRRQLQLTWIAVPSSADADTIASEIEARIAR
jgi:tRNA dimethylallyltransferase